MGADSPEIARARSIKPAPRPKEIRSVTSIDRGRGPHPGVYVPPYFWDDVLDGEPPRPFERGQGAYVVYHAIEPDAESRLAYSTIVSVKSAGDGDASVAETGDHVRVDSRINVQRRLFLEMIARERAFMNRVTSRWHEGLVRSLVKQRRLARRLPSQWMRKSALAVVRGEGRVGRWTIRATQRASDAVVQFPDDVYTKSMRVWTHLYGPLQRKGLWEGMKDPRRLSTEEKSVVLFLSTAILLGTIFLLNNLFILLPRVVPGVTSDVVGPFLAGYSELVSSFLWGVATAVVLPFPPSELLAVNAYKATGPVLAFATMVLSKAAGAWLVFFIGDSLNQAIEEQTQGKPRLENLVAWMHTNTEKYGLWILALFTAFPFLPDTLALYVFAVSGMPFRQFMMGALLGTTARYAAVIGILAFAGEGQLQDLIGIG